MLLGGESVDFRSTAGSKAAGIAVIYQEPTLFPDLSVTENIFMGRQMLGSGRRIDRHAMYAEAERLFTGLGVDLDPRRPALGLSIADQQIIEIAKAISLDARVLIMDEPTAALSGVEVERLFTVARRLRDEGRALVFISHRFDEAFALCDTVTRMRDGDCIGTVQPRPDAGRRAPCPPTGPQPFTPPRTEPPMTRVCFQLPVRPDRLEEYTARHAAAGPRCFGRRRPPGGTTTHCSCALTACSSATSRRRPSSGPARG